MYLPLNLLPENVKTNDSDFFKRISKLLYSQVADLPIDKQKEELAVRLQKYFTILDSRIRKTLNSIKSNPDRTISSSLDKNLPKKIFSKIFQSYSRHSNDATIFADALAYAFNRPELLNFVSSENIIRIERDNIYQIASNHFKINTRFLQLFHISEELRENLFEEYSA